MAREQSDDYIGRFAGIYFGKVQLACIQDHENLFRWADYSGINWGRKKIFVIENGKSLKMNIYLPRKIYYLARIFWFFQFFSKNNNFQNIYKQIYLYMQQSVLFIEELYLNSKYILRICEIIFFFLAKFYFHFLLKFLPNLPKLFMKQKLNSKIRPRSASHLACL